MTCDICNGSQRIKLRVYNVPSVTPEEFGDGVQEVREETREYPCPKCTKQAPILLTNPETLNQHPLESTGWAQKEDR